MTLHSIVVIKLFAQNIRAWIMTYYKPSINQKLHLVFLSQLTSFWVTLVARFTFLFRLNAYHVLTAIVLIIKSLKITVNLHYFPTRWNVVLVEITGTWRQTRCVRNIQKPPITRVVMMISTRTRWQVSLHKIISSKLKEPKSLWEKLSLKRM